MYHEYATSKAYADAQEKFEQECSSITTVEEVRQCFKNVIETAREPQRSEEDLYAQKEMAQWAFWMFVISFLVGVMSVGVAIVGIYWVRRTWNLQRRATEAATEATRAAVDTNRFQHRVFVAEQRAWIPIRRPDFSFLSPLEWKNDEARLFIQLQLKNTGRHPAQAVRLDTTLKLNIREQEVSSFVERTRTQAAESSETVVFPEEEIGFRHLLILYREQLDEYELDIEALSWKAIDLYPQLIACVDYGIVSKHERGHTILVAGIHRLKDKHILPIRYEDGSVRAEELMLQVHRIIAD